MGSGDYSRIPYTTDHVTSSCSVTPYTQNVGNTVHKVGLHCLECDIVQSGRNL